MFFDVTIGGVAAGRIKMELFAGLYTKPGEIVDLQGTSTPEDCVFGAWKAWSPCSVTCGGGSQAGFRSIAREADYGGKACPSTSKSRTCSPKVYIPAVRYRLNKVRAL